MFSVIIPYYNKEKYIVRCVNSVLNQVYNNYEIIIVDDGSTDDGLNTIISLNDSRIKIYSKSNGGVSSARNFGISKASNDYIAFLDADDYWSPWYLQLMMEVIYLEEDSIIYGANFTRDKDKVQMEESNLKYTVQSNFFNRPSLNILYWTSSTIIRKSFFESNLGFDENLTRGEDLDVWLRAIFLSKKPIYLKNILAYYSDEDEGQITKAVNYDIEKSILYNINDKFKELYKLQNTSFNKFISHFIYIKLWPYFLSKDYNKANHTLRSIPSRSLLFECPYHIPINMLRWLNDKTPFMRILNKYYSLLLKINYYITK